MDRMLFRPYGIAGKILIVAAGYIGAALVTSAALAVYLGVAHFGRRGSGGMVALGDSILFLWILGILAVPATAAALYFLRPWRLFWRLATIAAVIISVVAIGDLVGTLFPSRYDATSLAGGWSMLAPVRVLLAPPVAAGLLLAAVFAPGMPYRYTLVSATAVEAITFVWVFLIWSSRTA